MDSYSLLKCLFLCTFCCLRVSQETSAGENTLGSSVTSCLSMMLVPRMLLLLPFFMAQAMNSGLLFAEYTQVRCRCKCYSVFIVKQEITINKYKNEWIKINSTTTTNKQNKNERRTERKKITKGKHIKMLSQILYTLYGPEFDASAQFGFTGCCCFPAGKEERK